MSTAPTLGGTEAAAASDEMPERIRRLEDEVAELRETFTRLADVIIGEVKELRQSKGEAPTPPTAMVGEAAHPDIPHRSRRPWLLTEFLRDAGTALRMYFDPRYRVRRATQLMVPLIVVLFVLNGLFFRTFFIVPILSMILEKLGDVILAVLLYKVVSREVQRYRQALAQLVTWHDYRDRVTVVSPEPPVTQLETD